MDKHPINEFSDSNLQKIREMIEVNNIIGDPIRTADGIQIVPVSRVSFGFASGGADYTKQTAKDKNFGCGTGTGVTITPVAFLVIKDGDVKLLTLNAPANTTLDRVVEMVPQVLDKVSDWKKDKETDDLA